MKKQTAVMKLALSFRGWQRDWDRYDKEKINKPKSFDEFIEPFLELEKQQIIDAHLIGLITSLETEATKQATEYYNETYGSKGSDEHIVDTNKMISSQTEISDEEIKAFAMGYYDNNGADYYVELGAKWYREQLKK